jgi:hypothetical protein
LDFDEGASSQWSACGFRAEKSDSGVAVGKDSTQCRSGGGRMITVNLENDDQNDLFVSVIDLNRAGSPVVLNQVRINQAESLAVDIQEDGHGSGKIEWAAQQVDRPTQTVHRTVTASSGDTVRVTTFFG